MSVLIELAVPLILASVGIHALISGTDIFPALCRGAVQGLETLKDMLPTLIVLFPACCVRPERWMLCRLCLRR